MSFRRPRPCGSRSSRVRVSSKGFAALISILLARLLVVDFEFAKLAGWAPNTFVLTRATSASCSSIYFTLMN
jgi:hypothetical protein